MKKPALALALGIMCGLLLGTIYGYGPVKVPKSANSAAVAMATTTVVAKAVPSAISYVYPLYAEGILWGNAQGTILPSGSDLNPTSKIITGSLLVSAPTATTTNIASITGPFREYYDKVLFKAGWKLDIDLEAGGAGSEQWGYTKNNQILIFSYASNFLNTKDDGPLECPCTIVFTIVGGTEK